MYSIKSILAKKAQLYKAIKELEYWSHDEDEWRYVAIRDYEAAIKELRVVMVNVAGCNYADGWCGAIDEMVKKRYNFDEADIAEAKLFDYDAFIRKV